MPSGLCPKCRRRVVRHWRSRLCGRCDETRRVEEATASAIVSSRAEISESLAEMLR